MNKLDLDYQNLLKDILENGIKKRTRNGEVMSLFGKQIRHKMSEGFPLLTTKKMSWKNIVIELLWFLRGDTNIKYLIDNGCHIWDGDAYKNYTKYVTTLVESYKNGDILGTQSHIEKLFSNPDNLTTLTQEEFINKIKTDDEFAEEWGDLGSIYGKQWRSWEYQYGDEYANGHHLPTQKRQIDQIQNLINELKTNPDSRRLLVNAWNVGELDQMVLPPCFTENMLVKCKNGYKKISDISTEDYVLTEDGSYQRVYATHTTEYDNRLVGIRVYGNNTTITSTPDHPFLIKDKGYIKASEVTEDDYLGIPLNKNEIVPTFSSEIGDLVNKEDFWFLMGYFLGDGWLDYTTKEIFVTIDEKDQLMVLNRIKNIIDLVDISEQDDVIKKYVCKNDYFFDIFTTFGDAGENRIIPEFIYDLPNYFVSEFIDGFKLSDGSENDGNTKFYTISSSVAYGLQLLYSKLNIRVSVMSNKENDIFTINVSKQKNKSNKFIFDENYLWLKVKTISELSGKDTNGFVYNLSVENNHTYNVFNLVNHNCHYSFQVYTRELSLNERGELFRKTHPNKSVDDFAPSGMEVQSMGHQLSTRYDNANIPTRAISLMWNQRSVDTALGLPFNISSYALLLEIIAKMVNMIPDELIGNLGDCHIYSNQIDGVKEQLTRDSYPLPKLVMSDKINFNEDIDEFLNSCSVKDFMIDGYQSHSKIKIPLSN